MTITPDSTHLLKGVSAPVTGDTAQGVGFRPLRTFQGSVNGTGAVTASIGVQVSNDGNLWLTMATITLSGSGSAVDGFTSNAPWPFIRGVLNAITGTGATVDLQMSD